MAASDISSRGSFFCNHLTATSRRVKFTSKNNKNNMLYNKARDVTSLNFRSSNQYSRIPVSLFYHYPCSENRISIFVFLDVSFA